MQIAHYAYPASLKYNDEQVFMEERHFHEPGNLFTPVKVTVGLYKIYAGEIITLYEYVLKDSLIQA